MDIYSRRVANLDRLIAERYEGNQASFADAAGLKPPQVNRWLSKTTSDPRRITENSARGIERAIGLPTGWMDEDRAKRSTHAVEEVRAPYGAAEPLSSAEQTLVQIYRSLNRSAKRHLMQYALGYGNGQSGTNETEKNTKKIAPFSRPRVVDERQPKMSKTARLRLTK
jgi:hypothetical protein